ncbi:MAG: hypothetical protein AAF479_07385 [Pseudomonadota bacterium]
MRLMTVAVVTVLALVLFLIWFLEPVDPIAATYARDECRRVALVDLETGANLSGAEDLALTPDGESILVSAHDRFDAAMPNGGIYRVNLWELEGADRYEVRNVVDLDLRELPFRPHGIALSADGTRLAAINRVADGEAVVEIGDLEASGWSPSRRLAGETLCRANDLNFSEAEVETLRITLDRESCGFAIADIMPGSATGRVAVWNGGRLQTASRGLSFPNGISDPYVAETRKSRILRPTGTPIRVPGGPDNLTREDQRNLIVALHPSLRRLWLYLNGLWPSAASRIARVNVLSGNVEVLYDDPDGELFVAATSAVFAKDMLIAGSVADAGLLVCQRSGG